MPPPPMSWARHSSTPIMFLDPYFVVAFYKVGWGGGVSYRGGVGWVMKGWGRVGWVGHKGSGGVGWVGHEGVGVGGS